MTAIIYRYFYDPIKAQVVMLPPLVEAAPELIPLTESYARALTEGQARGEYVYLNTNGMPVLHVSPPKPPLNWDQSAILPTPTVEGFQVKQDWIISKLSQAEALETIKELRKLKQHTQLFSITLRRTNEDGSPITVVAQTDVGTWSMMQSIYPMAKEFPGRIYDWKFDSIGYEDVLGQALVDAYIVAHDLIEKQFSIERAYIDAVKEGRDVDLYAWLENP